MRAFLFIGGEYPGRDDFLEEYGEGDFIACADMGIDRALSWGLEPDLVVGDMDSLSDPKILEGFSTEKVVRLPVDKDDTDTESALKLLWRSGYEDIVLVGGGGGRLDHFLGLSRIFERRPRPNAWLCRGQKAFVLEKRIEFGCARGEIVSVFPLGPDTLRMKSEGLFWPLEGLEFSRGEFGISNRATAEKVGLEVLAGTALIIRPYPGKARGNPGSDRTLP